ncbi:DUF3895 domain-containing protein [Bacillus sp. FJAT-29937]|uniref:DUF3895 domain-containing protein n=1 Tax=Bacillus sp. FJAT-29937 TaxID=1720553 RepID=UPI00082C32C5|nr:DUF3895 domain-containing protein [Bacillus sp. FJAT-29937]
MNQISFDNLFEEEPKNSSSSSTSPLHTTILELLELNITSALEICERLIKDGLLSNERFSTNKPKAYPKVCVILDEMVLHNSIEFIEDKDRSDRIYRIKETTNLKD